MYNFFLEENSFSKMYNNIKLNEDIFLGNASELHKVDGLFQDLLDLVELEERGISKKNKSYADNILKEIKVIIDKMFNINMSLSIDYKVKSPSSVAYTVFSKDIIKVFESKVKEILISKETGYNFIKLRKLNVAFENVALAYFKYPEELSRHKIKANLVKFEGRHLTEILLHEIGHNVFISYYVKNNNGGRVFKFDTNVFNMKPVTVYDNMSPRVLDALVLSLVTIWLSAIGLSFSAFFIINDRFGSNNYMRIEGTANNLVVQYGYSKELYDTSVAINAIFTGNGNLFNRIIDRITWGIYGYQGIIMSDVYAMLQTELRNPNNSPKDIEHIEEVLEYYRKQRKEIKKKYK